MERSTSFLNGNFFACRFFIYSCCISFDTAHTFAVLRCATGSNAYANQNEADRLSVSFSGLVSPKMLEPPTERVMGMGFLSAVHRVYPWRPTHTARMHPELDPTGRRRSSALYIAFINQCSMRSPEDHVPSRISAGIQSGCHFVCRSSKALSVHSNRRDSSDDPHHRCLVR